MPRAAWLCSACSACVAARVAEPSSSSKCCKPGAIWPPFYLWPWMACMPATQEQLSAMAMDGLYAGNAGAVVGDGHGWPVCRQRRSSCRRWPWMACMPATQDRLQATPAGPTQQAGGPPSSSILGVISGHMPRAWPFAALQHVFPACVLAGQRRLWPHSGQALRHSRGGRRQRTMATSGVGRLQ